MAWSLLNHMIADKVKALLDDQSGYGPDVPRFFPREKAEAIIHAAIWGYSSREGGDAGCYAFMNLMDALGIKAWTFDEDEAKEIREMWTRRMRERAASPDGQ
jgi:hypothetical protein